MTLREVIIDQIRSQQAIPFSRFMELCLYHRELGYYSREREKFGRGGDFYTSSDLHAIYGRLMARQFDEMWRALGSPARIHVVELGPGRGLFAQDVLAWADKKFPDFARALHYTLVESSRSLFSRLEQRFGPEIDQTRVAIYASIDDVRRCEHAIVFANEFFDALPVEVVSEQGQLFITADESGRFVESWQSLDDATRIYIANFGVRPGPGERVEASPKLAGVIGQLAAKFERGFVVVVDYGYTRPELVNGRHRDTLRGFREHTLRSNVLDAPGEQDITADVNFTAIAELAKGNGMENMPLLRQSQFLIGIGEATEFADAFEGCTLPQEHTKRALQLKHLITPEGLGESFKVLVLYKNVERETVQQLSGMTFAR